MAAEQALHPNHAAVAPVLLILSCSTKQLMDQKHICEKLLKNRL
ncbi:hypothetical protein [Paenibacillus farraposensis]|nr:hypothetical protein [Paenibacillus farraposensis]